MTQQKTSGSGGFQVGKRLTTSGVGPFFGRVVRLLPGVLAPGLQGKNCPLDTGCSIAVRRRPVMAFPGSTGCMFATRANGVPGLNSRIFATFEPAYFSTPKAVFSVASGGRKWVRPGKTDSVTGTGDFSRYSGDYRVAKSPLERIPHSLGGRPSSRCRRPGYVGIKTPFAGTFTTLGGRRRANTKPASPNWRPP